MSGHGAVPKSTDRRTGGFRRTAGLDSSRPWSTARAQERSAYTSTKNGLTTPGAWETMTMKQVNVADTYRQWSTGARWTARTTQDHSLATNKQNLTSVNGALLIKVQATEKLAQLLEETLRTVNHEIRALEALPTKRITSYIRQTQEKIELNTKRLEVRKSRPRAELVDDEVHANLLSMDGLLRSNLAQLMHSQKATTLDIERLKESKRQLEADLRGKRSALQVDTRVLKEEDGLPEPPLGHTMGTGSSKMTIYPSIWNTSTQTLVKTALQRQAQAAKLRMAIDNCCQDVAIAEKNSRQMLHLAALDKINKTESLKNVLHMEHQQVVDELHRAKERDRAVCEQIVDLEDCIDKTRKQYSYRCQRPDVEKVVDEVELTMKKALTDQKALHKNLMASRPTLNANIHALQRSISNLDRNIQDKGDCLEVDKMAIMIDGRRAPSIAPSNASYRTSYVGTAVSRGGSTIRSSRAESMKSRMMELEEELAATRRSNQALEERAMVLSR